MGKHPLTSQLLATTPYIKMEVVNQYIDYLYTSLDEFEFEDQDELDYEEEDDLGDVDDRTTRAYLHLWVHTTASLIVL